jgi:hypothetical protein
MKIISFSLYLLAALQAAGDVFIPPNGWINLEPPNIDSANLSHVEAYTSPDNFVRVIVSLSVDPITTVRGADNYLQKMHDAAECSDNRTEYSEKIEFGKFEARFAQKQVRDVKSKELYLLDGYAIFTNSTVVSIMVLTNPQHENRKDIQCLLSHVNIPGDPIMLIQAASTTDTPLGSTTRNDNFAYHLGKQLTLFVVILVGITLIVAIVVRRNLRDPRARAVRAARLHRSRQYDHNDPY